MNKLSQTGEQLQARQYEPWQVGDVVKTFTGTALGSVVEELKQFDTGIVNSIEEDGDVYVLWENGLCLFHMTFELYRI